MKYIIVKYMGEWSTHVYGSENNGILCFHDVLGTSILQVGVVNYDKFIISGRISVTNNKPLINKMVIKKHKLV
jgi:hypothetical protein